MKLKFILFLSLSILFTSFSFAQTPLVAYKQGQEWTFLDSDGKQLFKAGGITQVGGYSEGFISAQVFLKGKLRWVYFNKKGQIAIATDAEQGVNFSEGKALIFNIIDPEKDIFEFGIIDSSGRLIKEIQYRDALSYSEGLAYVMKDGERGYLNHDGEMEIELEENQVGYAFSEGLAAVLNDGLKIGYINRKGEKVIDYLHDMPSNFNNGLARVADTATGKIGFMNKYNVLMIPKLYDEAYNFIEDRTMVGYYDQSFKMRWAMMDLNGNYLSNFMYDHAKSYRNGAALILYQGKWGFLDSTGNFLFTKYFDYAESFAEDGLAWAVTSDGRQGFIDKQGDMIIPLPKADYYFDLRFNKELKTSTKVER
jgi:hypothetical protein